MSTKRNLSINFLTQLSGKAVSIVIGLILTVILARALGDSLYGEYTTAITFLQLFGVIVDFGLTLTLAVMLSNKGANQEKVAGNIFGLRMTSAIIMFSLAPLMALPFPWSGNVRLGILIGAGAYICMAGATMLIGVFQKHLINQLSDVKSLHRDYNFFIKTNEGIFCKTDFKIEVYSESKTLISGASGIHYYKMSNESGKWKIAGIQRKIIRVDAPVPQQNQVQYAYR